VTVSQHGLVVFAKDKARVSAFYQQTLSLAVQESEASHDLLLGPGLDLVVHAIPAEYAIDIAFTRPPQLREDTPFKPVFTVANLAAVRQAAIVTSEQSKGVDFSFEAGQLVLSGRSAESGESRVELPIDHAGATVRIKLDPRFMVEFLRVLDPATAVTRLLAEMKRLFAA
jgi:hypothetical protein